MFPAPSVKDFHNNDDIDILDDDISSLFLDLSTCPVFKFEALHAYTFTCAKAPTCDILFCFEQHPPAVDNIFITNAGKFAILENPHTIKVIMFHGEGQGAYFLNNTLNSLHYELPGGPRTIMKKKAKTKQCRINSCHLKTTMSKVVDQKSNGDAFVSNNGLVDGGWLDKLIEAM
jgi:hypothetical protein